MMYPSRFSVLIARSAVALSLLSLGTSVSVSEDRKLAARVDNYLAPFVNGKNFIGAVLIAKGDRMLVNQGYGEASYELQVANSAETRFHVASVSKPFTAAAILILEQRGLLQISDPVSKYLPDFPNGEKITLQHLLTHTSGITNVNNLPEYQTASRFPQTPSSLIDLFKAKPLDFEPGTNYAYSNSNYNILAFVIEQVSHKPYGEFLRENIFDPLGMKNTGHDGNASDVIANAATGYQPRGIMGLERVPYLDWSSKTGNGSLYSTTIDLFKFVRAFGEGRVLSREKVKELWKERSGNNYGWFIRKRHGLVAVASNGRSPGFTSSIEYYSDRDVTVIVLSNSYSPVSQSPIADDLAALALGEPVSASGSVIPIEIASEQLRNFAGDFRFDETFFRPNAGVTIRLEGKALVLDWGSNTRSDLIPVGPDEFIDRQFWSRIKIGNEAKDFSYVSSGSEFRATRTSWP